MTDDLSLAPFRIHACDDGAQELWLFDGDMEEVEDVFDHHGAESNGHGWESLAWWLTHSEMPDLTDPIWFSSEGARSWPEAPIQRPYVGWPSAYMALSMTVHCSLDSSRPERLSIPAPTGS